MGKTCLCREFMLNLCQWIVFEGQRWKPLEPIQPVNSFASSQSHSHGTTTETFTDEPTSHIHPSHNQASIAESYPSEYGGTTQTENNPHRKPLDPDHSMGATGQQNPASLSTMNQEPSDYSDVNQQITPQINSRKRITETSSKKPSVNKVASSSAGSTRKLRSHDNPKQASQEYNENESPLPNIEPLRSASEPTSTPVYKEIKAYSCT